MVLVRLGVPLRPLFNQRILFGFLRRTLRGQEVTGESLTELIFRSLMRRPRWFPDKTPLECKTGLGWTPRWFNRVLDGMVRDRTPTEGSE